MSFRVHFDCKSTRNDIQFVHKKNCSAHDLNTSEKTCQMCKRSKDEKKHV